MNAKGKAKELVDRFLPYSYYHEMDNSMNRSYQQEDNSKQCALICVDEILKNEHDYTNTPYEENNIDYWKEVKIEIEKI